MESSHLQYEPGILVQHLHMAVFTVLPLRKLAVNQSCISNMGSRWDLESRWDMGEDVTVQHLHTSTFNQFRVKLSQVCPSYLELAISVEQHHHLICKLHFSIVVTQTCISSTDTGTTF